MGCTDGLMNGAKRILGNICRKWLKLWGNGGVEVG